MERQIQNTFNKIKMKQERKQERVISDEELDEARNAIIINNLKLIGESYEYSEKEREAFLVLFRYMNSFWWEILRELKTVKDDESKVDMLFRWLERQLTRDDIRLP